ncbi:antirepressor AbbA [Bacillaceae bacterium SIJ1]|uniref:antirepressor AbbA n=1 Tax=Litoribacterium kuwaitense TaxID=1398745 RepID=UPI0013EDCCAA|nr:antirepressor AbbA [Litoribacterium kuwaitense]NGP44413.1 antirepressor AbbA [Litoribacterium kuwaitense]
MDLQKLNEEEISLLLQTLIRQNLAVEIVASEMADLEKRIDPSAEDRLKKLSVLLDKLDPVT